jgi:hypothetical protein
MIETIIGLYTAKGGRAYEGEGVSQLEHALQSAFLAERAGAPRELVCAALDCPQLWALMVHAPATSRERVVTVVLETRIEQRVTAGEPHVVIAWPIGRDGRHRLAGAAILGPRGELCATGRQTAAVVDGWGVPLGRDHWAAPQRVAAC